MESSLTKTCWSEVKDSVQKANPTVFGLIEEINPSDDMPLYIAEYPYGTIIDDGIFYYPDEKGVLRPRSDPGLSQEVRDDFGYAGDIIPMGMVLDKMVENFTDLNNISSPWDTFEAGMFFALNGHLDETSSFQPYQLLSMSSGARSIYMLPNIGDAKYHGRIQNHLGSNFPAPKSLKEHWQLFKDLAKHQTGSEVWKSKLLLFSGCWINKIKNEKLWLPLYASLLKFSRQRNAFERNHKLYDIGFSQALQNKNLKPDPYLADTAKHILKTMSGGPLGFKVANDDEAAPVCFIQEIYLRVYKKDGYFPHIVVPAKFDHTDLDSAIYYSLQAPTTLEYSPKAQKDMTTIKMLRDTKHIVDNVKADLLHNQTKLQNTRLIELIQSTNITFFHSQDDKYGEVEHTSKLMGYDNNLLNNKKMSAVRFATHGAFLRGCVLLTIKKS